MKNFKPREERSGGFRGGSAGGKPSFGGAKKSWGSDRSDRGGNGGPARDREVVMHKATCSHCGKSCEVPFFPSGEKPVFCRDCFNRTRDSVNPRGEPSKYSNHGPRQSYGDKPSAPRRDFVKPEYKPVSAPANDDIKKYFMEISAKLDRLVNNIERLSEVRLESRLPLEAPKKVKEVKIAKAIKAEKIVKSKPAPKKK